MTLMSDDINETKQSFDRHTFCLFVTSYLEFVDKKSSPSNGECMDSQVLPILKFYNIEIIAEQQRRLRTL